MARPGEIRLKAWATDEAMKLGIKTHSVYERLNRGKYPTLKMRRMNSKVIFVSYE